LTTTTRRRFAKLVTLAAATAPLFASAQTAAPPPPPAQPQPDEKKESAAKPAAAALTAVIKAEYGEHLDPAELQKIETDLTDTLDFVSTMRKFKLSNGDEPDFIFSATGRK